MIVCVSLNPAIDRRLILDQFSLGAVNRARQVQAFPGGKAAHVAMAAQALGEEVIWVGFLGGRTGDQCERGLLDLHIAVRRIRTRSETRTNLEILDAARRVTEILEPGGEIGDSEIEELLSACDELFQKYRSAAIVALCGSLPPGVPDTFYARLITIARRKNTRVLLDTSGEALRQALGAVPDLVKPNRSEAEHLCNLSIQDHLAAAQTARRIIRHGPLSVALSLGASGIVWQADKDSPLLNAVPPTVPVTSTVGCGDAVLAGFAVAFARNLPAQETLRLATACGTANCLAAMPGGIELSEVERILPLVKVETLE